MRTLYIIRVCVCLLFSLSFKWLVFLIGRKWNFWEIGSHWHLGQSFSLSHYCIQPEEHHSHKYNQHLQRQHQLCYLHRCLLIWHLLWSLQDNRILHIHFISGTNSRLMPYITPFLTQISLNFMTKGLKD